MQTKAIVWLECSVSLEVNKVVVFGGKQGLGKMGVREDQGLRRWRLGKIGC